MSKTQEMFETLVSAIRDELREEFMAALNRGAPSISQPFKRSKQADASVLSAQLLRHLRKSPDQRVEEIARGLGATTKDLKLPITKLLASKVIKKQGEKRATKYSVR